MGDLMKEAVYQYLRPLCEKMEEKQRMDAETKKARTAALTPVPSHISQGGERMSYDSEALLALRKAIEMIVEQEQLRGGSDNISFVLITPYLLFHMLDKLESIDETLEAIVKSEAIQGKWDG